MSEILSREEYVKAAHRLQSLIEELAEAAGFYMARDGKLSPEMSATIDTLREKGWIE